MKLYNNLVLKFSKKKKVIAIDSDDDHVKVKEDKLILLKPTKVKTISISISSSKSKKNSSNSLAGKNKAKDTTPVKTKVKESRSKAKNKEIPSKNSHSRSDKKEPKPDVKVNLNINIQEINNAQTNIYYYNKAMENTFYIDSESISPRKASDMKSCNNSKSPSKWKKLSNTLSIVKSFHRYDTKNLGSENEIDQDLNDYKTRLHNNTIKSRFVETQPELKEPSYTVKGEYEDELRRNILSDILE
jgi:hypothetical protein